MIPAGSAALSANVIVNNDLRPPEDATWLWDHVVNGRFLSQSLTGVQRYAYEVVGALDDLLAARNARAELMAPRNTATPSYKAFRVSSAAWTSGYLWEQAELTLRAARRPLLSLCNMGPLAAPEQILCIHDVNVFHCPDSYSSSFRRIYRALLPRLARRAVRVTTVSQASRRELAALFSLPEKRIAILPNGSEHVFAWRAERSQLVGAVAGFRPFVLMIGSAARHKNIALVLGLAEALAARGIDIVVAGGARRCSPPRRVAAPPTCTCSAVSTMTISPASTSARSVSPFPLARRVLACRW